MNDERFVIRDEIPDGRFLVIGPPRGGFSLLLSLLSIFTRCKTFQKSPAQIAVDQCSGIAGTYILRSMLNALKGSVAADDIFYSGEFQLLAGGPKWLDDQDADIACVRKYFGIRDRGDFTFIQYHPRFVLECDDILHSHSHPRRWLDDPHYATMLKFGSIRHPIDILHSSVFSINALTSEYLQRSPPRDQHEVRWELAVYKLSDANFVDGLVTFLKKSLDEFISAQQDMDYVMRWEDFITQPKSTIRAVACAAGLTISDSFVDEVFERTDHRNLLRWHQHNYRKGVADDWKQGMTNTHMEIFKQHGFDDYLDALGYPRIEMFDPAEYTPTQRLIEDCLRTGKAYQPKVDDNVFWFAFNKTNFVSSKYNFKSFPRTGGVKVERSSLNDHSIAETFGAAVGRSVDLVNEFLIAVHESAGAEASADRQREIRQQYRTAFARELSAGEMNDYDAAFARIEQEPSGRTTPILLSSYRAHNIVNANGGFLAVPQAIGAIDLSEPSSTRRPGIRSAPTLSDVFPLVDGAFSP